MTLRYAQNIRGGGPSNTAETYGWPSNADWHVTASNDSGSSHILNGRLYIVQCLWCEDAFAADTKGEAMGMFRTHESAMAEQQAAEANPEPSEALNG